MRTILVSSIALITFAVTDESAAGWVDHSSVSGVVAVSGGQENQDEYHALDSDGLVWSIDGSSGWTRVPAYDPPVPLAEIAFWDRRAVVTFAGEAWLWHASEGWINYGFRPTSGVGTPDQGGVLEVIPNPSHGSTTVALLLEAASNVSAWILDASGRVVRHLLDENLPAGEHRIAWDGRDDRGDALPAGVYFSRVRAGAVTVAGRVVLVGVAHE